MFVFSKSSRSASGLLDPLTVSISSCRVGKVAVTQIWPLCSFGAHVNQTHSGRITPPPPFGRIRPAIAAVEML